jgi:predicted lipoprotein with Yx(FWY)xxD motif
MKRLLALAALPIAAAIIFVACGGSDGGGSSGDASRSTDTATTVATRRIDGRNVLVDADGNALYISEQEAGGMVRCTGACLEFWEPFTIDSGQPSGSVTGGTLGVLERPDGTTQVTFNGDPVYRFTEDEPGTVNGDGLDDAFEGQQFTWHVVSAGNDPTAPPSTSNTGGTPGY